MTQKVRTGGRRRITPENTKETEITDCSGPDRTEAGVQRCPTAPVVANSSVHVRKRRRTKATGTFRGQEQTLRWIYLGTHRGAEAPRSREGTSRRAVGPPRPARARGRVSPGISGTHDTLALRRSRPSPCHRRGQPHACCR